MQDTVITLRVFKSDKQKISKRAKEYGMSMNEYIRFKLLETGDAPKNTDKNFDLYARILISSYVHTRMLALKTLSEEEAKQIEEECSERFKNLGIEK